MNVQYDPKYKTFYISIAFFLLTLAFIFYKYYTTKNALAKEYENTLKLADSLTTVQNNLNQYRDFLKGIQLLVDNKNQEAQHVFAAMAESQDTLIQNALGITKILNRPEVKIIEVIKPVEKIVEINESKNDFESQNLKKIEQKTEPTDIKEDKIETIDKPIFFKSSKGVKIEYAGQVIKGKANGYGVGLFETGGVYKGYWSNNKRHGKGVYSWEDGEKYSGDFVNDKREGFGSYTWKNGEKYEGQWKNDMRDGKGTIYKSNGEIKVAGLFVKDNLQ